MKKLSKINETIWGRSMNRALGKEVRKENEIIIAENNSHLIQIINEEIEKQGPDLDLNHIVVSDVTDFNSIFWDKKNLKSIDISEWDVSNAKYMEYMFKGCENLESIYFPNWDVRNVRSMNYMFANCTSLTSLDISAWCPEKTENMIHMFSNCTNLEDPDLSNWSVPKLRIRGLANAFLYCKFKYRKNPNINKLEKRT